MRPRTLCLWSLVLGLWSAPSALAQQAPVLADQSTGLITRPTPTLFFGNTTNSAAIAAGLGWSGSIWSGAQGGTGINNSGKTLNFGAGGTLGTAAFTASTAYVPAYSGLTTNGLLQATGATTVASTLTPAGLTSLGVNSVTSAAGSDLTFGVGTGGTGLTIANSTKAATFAASIDATGNISTKAGNQFRAYIPDNSNYFYIASTPTVFGFYASGASPDLQITGSNGLVTVAHSLTVSGSILGSGGSAPTSTTSGSNQFTAGGAFNGPVYMTALNATIGSFTGATVTHLPSFAGQQRFSAQSFSGNYSAGYEIVSAFNGGTPTASGLLFYPSAYTGTNAFGESVATPQTVLYHGATTGALKLGTTGGANVLIYQNSTLAATFTSVTTTLAGNLTVSGPGTSSVAGGLTIAKVQANTPSSLSYAAPTSVDVTLGNVFTVTTVNATGSVTFNATAGGTAGQVVRFIITNDATSAKTITFGTNFSATGTLTPGAASQVCTISFLSNGTKFYELGRVISLAP